jgi:hypothetical protein
MVFSFAWETLIDGSDTRGIGHDTPMNVANPADSQWLLHCRYFRSASNDSLTAADGVVVA